MSKSAFKLQILRQALGLKGPCSLRAGAVAKKDSRGVVSIQFLLVLIIVLVFFLSFFGLCLTLVNGSAAQYLSYSAARSLALGDVSQSVQESNAKAGYQRLRRELFQSGHSGGGWFNIAQQPALGFNPDYSSFSTFGQRKMFYGAAVSFKSKVAGLKIPFLAAAAKGGGALDAKLGSYLGREPSQQECEYFNSKREGLICGIYNGICQGALTMSAGDNGC